MNAIVHNMLAINAKRQFNIVTKSKAKSTEKLSSGYRINRAADDAAGLSISEKMRNQIRGLNQASFNILDGVSLIKTADGALNELHYVFARQRELLVKAANEVHSEDDLQSIEDELSELWKEQDRIFDDTKFNGIPLFKGKDTIISGPNTTVATNTSTPVDSSSTSSSSKVVWINKTDPVPTDTHTESPEKVVNSYKSTFKETETIHSVNDKGYTLYDENSIYTTYEYSDTYNTITDIHYDSLSTDSTYTDLRKPGDMVGSNGYINVQNVARNLNLSCAMSQLGVKIDGNLVSYSLYNANVPKSTTTLDGGNTAITTYDLGNGLSLSQTIALTGASGSQSLKISYAVTNTDTNNHTVDVRLAFDTMNTQVTAQKNNPPYQLESEFASIMVSGTGHTKSALGDIGNLYNVWDDSKITAGSNVSNHTGVGFWWNTTSLANSSSTELGSVTYGPITLKQDPYKVTTTIEKLHKQEVTTTETKVTSTILPQYLDIQSGANAGEKVPIRLYNLSSDKLKTAVGKDKDVSAFHASDSLEHMNRVVKKISSVRSYYGAMQNRLETTYTNNQNYKENLESSESKIRDTDMATVIVENSKYSVLQQAAQAMLAQANQSNKDVLSLLQG